MIKKSRVQHTRTVWDLSKPMIVYVTGTTTLTSCSITAAGSMTFFLITNASYSAVPLINHRQITADSSGVVCAITGPRIYQTHKLLHITKRKKKRLPATGQWTCTNIHAALILETTLSLLGSAACQHSWHQVFTDAAPQTTDNMKSSIYRKCRTKQKQHTQISHETDPCLGQTLRCLSKEWHVKHTVSKRFCSCTCWRPHKIKTEARFCDGNIIYDEPYVL